MALGRPEALSPRTASGSDARRFAKRAVHRRRRQEERRDPENAPERPGFRGWWY